MKKVLFLLGTFALFPILVAGCGMRASLVSRALPDQDWPKKRVMLMPAVDLTGIPLDELSDTVSAGFSKTLAEKGFFHVHRGNESNKSRTFKPGQPFVPELMSEAREMSINAIIFQTLNPLEANPHKTGIWPFRRKAWRFTLSMNVDIVDVNRGTILLSKEIVHAITLSDEEAKDKKERSPNVETKKRTLRQYLPDIIEKAATAASLSLNSRVWTGTIVSADDKRILINAGRDVGLRAGVVFEVFGEGEPITSFKGQTHHLPGPKVGEIRTVRVEPRYSWAEPIAGTAFKSGQLIQVKK
jgi:hypothetical protein